MSSYFDSFDRQVYEASQAHGDDTGGFLKQLVLLEEKLKRDSELFAGDVETPEDLRQCIVTCIALNECRYDGGDFLGVMLGGVLLPSRGAQWAATMRSSKLGSELHSLWHDIARMRYQMRYGLVMDNPEYAVANRDKFAERKGRHPWQKKAPTDKAPFVCSDYRQPKPVAEGGAS